MKKGLLINFIIIFIYLLLIRHKVAYAATPPFDSTETFDYSNGLSPATNWNQENSSYDSYFGSTVIGDVSNNDSSLAKWTVNNGTYQLHITPHSTLTFVRSFPTSWPSGLNDYSIDFDMFTLNGTFMDRNFTFRYIDTNHYYEIHTYSINIYLDKGSFDTINHQNHGITLDKNTFNFEGNHLYHFRIEALQNNIKVYLDNNPVPILEAIDTSDPYLIGKAGFESGSGSNSSGDVWFDNILILPLGQTPTPTATPTEIPTSTPTSIPTAAPTPTPITLAVEDIKQFATPWGTQTYDSAEKWSNNPTISRWGCALTSATMVLRYFNHNTLPNLLNNWLKNEKDGFIGNGLVNWIAITRFSKNSSNKIDSTKDAPTLEFERILSPSFDDFAGNIDNNLPPIIKVPGHFVIGKGYNEIDILVNDPASYLRNDLTDVEGVYGSALQMVKFTPSMTNLSYIMLIANKNLNLELFDNNQNPVGSEATEGALTEDNEIIDPNIKNGEDIRIFLLPKPAVGTYILKTSGINGKFTIDAYLYDTSGNLIGGNISNLMGVLTSGSVNYYQLTFDPLSSNNKIKISLDSMLKDIDSLWKLGWIKNMYTYNQLKIKILIAKKLQSKPQTLRNYLKLLKLEMTLARNSKITKDGYEILIFDLNNLIGL